ncbi:MAG TPA: chromosome segregation protein SMC [Chthonomonadales bacterium]|nr:chromosome segregation protein SMC [Chthonomonadales bacterium]
MRLKKLHLTGFKSFADKTEIEFSEGLTAVVGPNGCGKSNIGDALLWVLGEQNPRLLRGADARDVIFSGAEKRKPLGMAEVRLTVDNADGTLPIDFAEVAVSRRVYRSGESQYLLNNTPCRLKDIVDLFLDTGMGKGAYAFVSQTEVDAVLSARPEDRRELFEEAAGIKKYRVRKREAVRKLEHAEANLTRVRDIVAELERQREPLREQAENARRYLALAERLAQIEVDLLVSEVRTADYELYAARRDLEMDQQAIGGLDRELADLERQGQAASDRLAAAEQELETARLSHQGALTAVERAESRLALLRERSTAHERTADGLDAELRALNERAASLVHDLQGIEREMDRMTATEATGADELKAARAELRDVERRLAEAQRADQDRQGALRRLAADRAAREASLTAKRDALETTAARLHASRAEAAAIEADAGRACRRLQELVAGHEALAEATAEAGRRHAAADAARESLAGRVEPARAELRAAEGAFAECETRLTALSDMQRSGDGYYQGVRAVLSAARLGKLKGEYTPVVELLRVPSRLRVAIEVALGSSAQDVLCNTEDDARQAIAWLKQQRAGRATFLALPLLRPPATLTPSGRTGDDGIVGVASELVGADPCHAPAIRLLLGRCLVAENLEAAVAASRTQRGWSRIVTIEGEVLTPGGALTGGSLHGRGAHLVGRKGEIDDLTRDMPARRDAAVAARGRLDELTAELERTARDAADAAAELGRLRVEAASASRDREAAEREADRLRAAAKAALAWMADLEREEAASREALQQLEREVAATAQKDASFDEAYEQARRLHGELICRRDAAAGRLTELEVKAGKQGERLRALRHAAAGARSSLEHSRAAIADKQSRREQTAAEWRETREELARTDERLGEARLNLQRCDGLFQAWRDRRQAALQESFEKASATKQKTEERAARFHGVHDAELRIARLEVKLAQASERLQQEYAISQEEALAREDPAEVDRSTAQEIARLRRELRQMGQVNTGAAEEFDRVTERLTFLSTQRDDIEASRRSLLGTISEIDESTRGVFLETFEAVSAQFQGIFHRLFGGGLTRLRLTDPSDLLETGIEIIAQPPGKKPQLLSLLSGGERALTAVALLFAFIAVRPSPFVLLDEVDAPLDGPNVEKFVSLVRDFSERTQFLLITHNPTTIEAAPRWYGVTMRDAGVSTVIAYRVPPQATAGNGAGAAAVVEEQAPATS